MKNSAKNLDASSITGFQGTHRIRQTGQLVKKMGINDTKKQKTGLQELVSSKNMLNEVFSFLDGGTIVQKIALLNKSVRSLLKILAPFAKTRSLTLIVNQQQK